MLAPACTNCQLIYPVWPQVAETIANQPAEEEVVAEAAPVEAVQYVAQPGVNLNKSLFFVTETPS
jgi:hypothetical protein